MTTLEHDEAAFATLVASLDLDMSDPDSLAPRAIRAGTRLRRRRTATGFSVTAVLALAGAGILAGVGDGAPHGGAPTIATQPSQGPHRHSSSGPEVHTGQGPAHLRLDHGLVQLRDLARGAADKARTPMSSLDRAVLVTPGWALTSDGDDKSEWARGADSIEIVWRPASEYGEKWSTGQVVGHTTLDGDPAVIYTDRGQLTVVAPPRDGLFLTLTGTAAVSEHELELLAPDVHRR